MDPLYEARFSCRPQASGCRKHWDVGFLSETLETLLWITCRKATITLRTTQLTAQRLFHGGTASPTSMKTRQAGHGEPVKMDRSCIKPAPPEGLVPDRYRMETALIGKRVYVILSRLPQPTGPKCGWIAAGVGGVICT